MTGRKGIFATRNLVLMATLSALASALAYFPHLHIPPTLLTEVEFSDVPVLIAGFYLHPVCGVIVALIKSLLHLPMTETGCLGELLTFVQAVVTLVPMWFFHRCCKRGELAAKLAVGAALDVCYGALAGALVIVPLLGVDTIGVGAVTLLYLIRAAIVFSVTFAVAMGAHSFLLKSHLLIHAVSPHRGHAEHCATTEFPVRAETHSAEETRALAERFAARLENGDVVFLRGDLGAGKTVFVKGVAAAFGIDPDSVLSPTFALMRQYEGRLRIVHCDLYRTESLGEIAEAGILEALTAGDAVCFVEWPDLLGDAVRPTYEVTVTASDETRTVVIGACE